MGNSTGNAEKKSTVTGKKDKTEKGRWNMLGQKEEEKSNSTSKTNNTTRGNK